MSDFDDDLGALDLGDIQFLDSLQDVGAVRRRPAARGRRGIMLRNQAGNRAMPARALIPQVPGVPAPGLRLQPLGFPTLTFNASSGTTLTATTRPQRPFKGQRLVIDIARTGATSTGLVSIAQLLVGTNNQMVSPNPIGAGAFSPGAYDTNMVIAAATPGVDVTVQYVISAAPTATDTVVVGTTIMGTSAGA